LLGLRIIVYLPGSRSGFHDTFSSAATRVRRGGTNCWRRCSRRRRSWSPCRRRATVTEKLHVGKRLGGSSPFDCALAT
jgi:hypothetical protein